MPIKPGCLKVGDIVGIIAPSDAVEKASLEKSAEIIKSWGLKLKFGKHIYSKVGDFMAGTPEDRQDDLRTMIHDPEVKVIWAATGGYAATEVLAVFDKETIEYLKQNPKWLIGYSDVCLLQNAFTSYNIVSLMGPSVWGLSDWDNYSRDMVRQILFGEDVKGVDEKAKWTCAIIGQAEGKLVAANLETLIFSFGTRFDPIMYGNGEIILALEELDIEKSTLQRQIDIIFSHKKANRIKGLIIGRLVNIKELSYPEWGVKVTPQGLITDRAKKLNIPVAFCEDFGHPEWDYSPFPEIKKHFSNRRFITLPNCVQSRLTVGEKECKLEYLESICHE